MAASRETRQIFIASVQSFLRVFGFDGIDIDWEYPVAPDRGGIPADFINYVTFLSELRSALGTDTGISITIPSAYWYMRGFDLAGLAPYVDWFNFMSYDLHGTWDGDNPNVAKVINPHTNLTEISLGLDLLWRNQIDPAKVLLGLGFYGRSFTLSDPSCTTPGVCGFSTGGVAGPCTSTSGILSDYEMSDILASQLPAVQYDAIAGVNWMTFDQNQWVSYDDERTLHQKAVFASGLCMTGTFAWALDLGGPGTLNSPNNMNPTGTDLNGANPESPGTNLTSGSGIVYIDPKIWSEPNPIISCMPPCIFVLPPYPVPSTTTVSFAPWTTSLEVGWATIGTTTLSNGVTTTTTGYTRIIQTTTIYVPPG